MALLEVERVSKTFGAVRSCVVDYGTIVFEETPAALRANAQGRRTYPVRT
jgi:hypothetical protein